MANNKLKYFILTGDPGVGKTTITKKISSALSQRGVKVSGFYTEEVRRNIVREGFDVVTLAGDRGRLARDQSLLNVPVKHSVGKYGVLLQEFENVALPSLKKIDKDSHLLVIDEIGKMEFFSAPFKVRVREIFDDGSKEVVLATIPVRKSDSLIEAIRNNKRARVWMVTRDNRSIIHEEIMEEMMSTLEF